MNGFEREQLTRFLQDLASARAEAKDAEAERLIQDTCSRQPDANYLLTQRCLLLDQALKQAQAEMARLQNELESAHGTGKPFLNANAWGNTRTSKTISPSAQTQPAPGQAPASPVNSSSWGGAGLLGTLASTAAGVVAGSFLFQGLGHLMGQHANASALSGAPTSPLMNEAENNAVLADNSDYMADSNFSSELDDLVPSDSDLDMI